MANMKSVYIPSLGHNVVLVPRAQMRRMTDGRTFAIPTHLPMVAKQLPTPPASIDWTPGDVTPLPMLGNDRYGDCYYVAICKQVIVWLAARGVAVTFDEAAVIKRYLQLSNGDNGLSDSDVFPEFTRGIVGPNGPHKIYGSMTIKPGDRAAMRLAMYLYGPLLYTASLLNTWLDNVQPGATWDADGQPDPMAGHAMLLTSDNGLMMDDETWGLRPPIHLTHAGLEASDPEVIVCFSPEWFDPATGKAPNGYSYDELAGFWPQFGGGKLPPNPFPVTPPIPPTPTPPPTPVPPGPGPGPSPALIKNLGISLACSNWSHGLDAGSVAQLVGTAKIVSVEPVPPLPAALAGIHIPPVILALLREYAAIAVPIILADLAAGKSWQQIAVDVVVAIFASESH